MLKLSQNREFRFGGWGGGGGGGGGGVHLIHHSSLVLVHLVYLRELNSGRVSLMFLKIRNRLWLC